MPVVCDFLTTHQWEPLFIPRSSSIPFGDLSHHCLCPSSSWVPFPVCIDLQAFRQSSGTNPSLAARSEMVFCLSCVRHWLLTLSAVHVGAGIFISSFLFSLLLLTCLRHPPWPKVIKPSSHPPHRASSALELSIHWIFFFFFFAYGVRWGCKCVFFLSLEWANFPTLINSPLFLCSYTIPLLLHPTLTWHECPSGFILSLLPHW